MSKSNAVMRMRRACSPLLVVAVVVYAAPGSAQVGTAAPWSLNGSDTLEQMVRQAIVDASPGGRGPVALSTVGPRCQTPNSLVARGHCATAGTPCSTTSGGVACPTGDTCVNDAVQDCVASPDECPSMHSLSTCKVTNELFYAGGGSTTGETNLRNNVQSMAPMSRNFRDTVIFTTAAQTTRRSFCKVNPLTECTTNAGLCTAAGDACEPRGWDQIYARNVVALDAGVIVTKQGGIKNFQLPITGTDESQAAPNTDPGNFAFLSPGTGYTQILAIVLSGVDGSGSFAACSDPRRINAIQDLAAAQGTASGTLSHFYRRDDNSGTTDTFKEKLQISRFCNGRAVGINGTNKSNPNMNNQDYDPIRRPCVLIPGQRQTQCTNVTAVPPVACNPGDANCTQGLVVALSVGDNDTSLADVTTTIGSRVDGDPDSLGFAGREAVQSASFLVKGPNIRTRSPSNNSVRGGFYMLSRKLFIQFADQDGSAITDVTNNTLSTTGGAARIDAERRLWNWITEPELGRCNFDPIVKQYGFITCLDSCTADPCADPQGNFCCLPNPAPLFAGAPSACVPGAGGGGPAFWPVDDANAGTNLGGACTAGSVCCSTGAACPASLVCPEAGLRPANSPCGKASDCASGVCADLQSIGINICG